MQWRGRAETAAATMAAMPEGVRFHHSGRLTPRSLGFRVPGRVPGRFRFHHSGRLAPRGEGGGGAGAQALVDATAGQVQEVVATNMLGTLLATRAAILAMEAQAGGGHIFNVDGAGADGSATPNYAAYGATKSGGAIRLPPG